ncbi:MAG: formylmethanofuran dehydrogenase [Methanobacterium sp.]|nr:MAG: formylmethanofuran dehydrogenase [Methanobacterium sp.]
MSDFDILLEKGRNFHGEVCPGIVLGTKVAMTGMRELGMDPFVRNRDLMVYVEIDRCMADAVQAVTGITMGHRTLKYKDYGKFAATFLDLSNGKAVRVSVLAGPPTSSDSSNEDNKKPDMKEMVEKLSKTPEEELLVIEEVKVDIKENDIPGFPKFKAFCEECGDRVLDRREVIIDGQTLCKACAEGPYYQKI